MAVVTKYKDCVDYLLGSYSVIGTFFLSLVSGYIISDLIFTVSIHDY